MADLKSITVHCPVCGVPITVYYTVQPPALSELQVRRWRRPHAVAMMMDLDSSPLTEHINEHRSRTELNKAQL